MEGTRQGGNIPIDGREAKVVVCSLCGSNDGDTLFVHHRFSYQRCRRCRLVRVNPQLTQASIRRIYEEGYEGKRGRGVPGAPRVTPDQARVLEALSRLAGGRGRLLDVGCFEGRFLWAARASGWETSGTEISPAAVAFARDEWGLDVRLGALGDVSFRDGEFDAVVLLDVVEHLPDPRRTLEEVHRVLRDGGVVYVWTPNFDSLTRRFAGRRWGAVVFPWHLYLFSAETLARMMAETGFATVGLRTTNWLLEFRDPYAALTRGQSLGRPPRVVRRFQRWLDYVSRPMFGWADDRGRHWGAQISLYARKES